jgi:hypothetical protein
MKQEGELMSIDFQLLSKQNLNLKLTLAMLQGMVLLVDQLQSKANWDVGLSIAQINASELTLRDAPDNPGSGTLH